MTTLRVPLAGFEGATRSTATVCCSNPNWHERRRDEHLPGSQRVPLSPATPGASSNTRRASFFHTNPHRASVLVRLGGQSGGEFLDAEHVCLAVHWQARCRSQHVELSLQIPPGSDLVWCQSRGPPRCSAGTDPTSRHASDESCRRLKKGLLADKRAIH